ncbi:FAD-dependent monooxygenase [Aureispira anguillae]|uniref:FAD-dependent monooxygenase n=1 Tax=Aureispira anguillae TaxID=2864201 RepID=A0A915YEC2_9BACT|nr:FAD-dependent monooxygenase [Aureispira anguillae]BDS11446.1 FAD-dependent monooxygenase [Aureispira anguillae]
MKNYISIIGGGIGGLTTALSFDKLNIPYKLYERAEQIKAVGAGIWLSPNALQVLEWINPKLLKEIQDAGNSFSRILVADHQLNPISDSKQDFVQEKFGFTTMAIHRGKLQQILYKYVQQDRIELNKEFKKYSTNSDKSITINFTDGSWVDTDSIIGADGINSKVRKQLFPNSQLRYSGQTCWRGVADYDLNNELESVGFTLWGKKLQFGVSKISEGKVYWFAVKLSAPNLQDDKKNLRQLLTNMFAEFHPLVNRLIENTASEKIFRGNLSDLELLNKWNLGNICLIGDAAHSMTPDLGQGGAQAIEDAFYLSNFIDKSSCLETGYDAFYAYRKSKVEKLVKQSRLTSKIAITNRLMEVIRNFMLKNTPESYLKKQMLELYKLDKTIATPPILSIKNDC